jgi:CubicO group peptidase (beta-lactamase class C family)
MASADIGWPATSARPDQPRGHAGERPLALGEGRLGAWLAPAGDVCCSIEDLARFASAHLRGLRGEDGLLRAATVELLHTPPEAASGRQVYAHGWVVRRDGGEPIHWHNGSAGTFFAQVELAPQGNRAFAVAVNAMTPDAQLAIEAVLAALRERYRD